MNSDYDLICYLIPVSEDILAVKPLPLVSAGSNIQFGVVYGLLVPLAVTLAEQGLCRKLVEVNHLIV